MDWKKVKINNDIEIWTPIPDSLEKNDSIDFLQRQTGQQTVNSILIDNVNGLDDYVVKYPGNFLYFDSPCNLFIKLESKENNDPIPIYSGQRLIGKFSKIFITSSTKTEAPIILNIGKNIQLDHSLNKDYEYVDSGSIALGSYPLTLTFKIGHLLKSFDFFHVINSATSPSKYLSYIRVFGTKYLNGVAQTVFNYLTTPGSGNNNYWQRDIQILQTTITAQQAQTRILFFNDYAPYSIDYFGIELNVSVAGIYSNNSWNAKKQRG